MERKTYEGIGLAFFIFFAVMAIIYGIFGDSIANWTKMLQLQGNYMLPLLVYYSSQLSYIALIAGIIVWFRHVIFRAVIASVLFVEALDMVSFPHCLSKIQEASINLSNYLCSDTIIVNWMTNFLHLSYQLAYSLYYYVFPTLLIVICIMLLGLVKFGKQVVESTGIKK